MPNQKPLSVLFDEYIKERRFCSHLRTETMRGYSAVFGLFLRLMPEITSLDLCTTEMVIEFFHRLATRERIVGREAVKTGIKSATIKTYWGKLHSFFVWLKTKGLIENNPLSNIKPPQVVYEDVRALEETEIRKLYSAIALHSSNTFILRRDIAMVSLLVFCGLRLGEFISLEGRDIDFDRRLLCVRGNTSKSQKTRYIPMHPTLQLHLRDYVAERNRLKYTSQYLIVSSSGDNGLSRHGLKHWVQSLCRKSGVRFHLHQLRHTFACNLALRDVNVVKIQKLLGHASLVMTMTYLRSIGTEDMQDDIGKLSI